MLYLVLLFLHSWLRWLALAGLLALGIRAVRGRATSAAWTTRDSHWWSTVVGLVGIQLVVGLVLVLWASPIARAAWSAGLQAALAEPVLLVFGFVHPLAMIVAVGVLHGGWSRIRRGLREGEPDRARHATALRATAICTGIMLAAIPWPGLPWTAARPVFRMP